MHVIKMDAENRRIVLSVADYYKEQPKEELEAYITAHPRREDLVAADVATEVFEGDEDLADIDIPPAEGYDMDYTTGDEPAAAETVEAAAEETPGESEEDTEA
jgi:TATA-binding protein-associated factor Taf7